MSATNRAALLTKTHKILKKHYEPVAPPADRPLLEHLLYACCLENAAYGPADDAFAKLQASYFDWNEVRVTTVAELSESLSELPDPASAATRLKRCLQGIFETHYSFDLEFLRKQNIGKSVKQIERYQGITSFVVAYATQNALGGHAIAIDKGTLDAAYVLGIASEAEAQKDKVPGVERAIPKSKGVEFASLLHQLGADFHASPFSTRVRGILLEIADDAKDRMPKRATKTASKSKSRVVSKSKSDKPSGTEKKPASKKKSTKTPAKKSPTKRLAKKKPR